MPAIRTAEPVDAGPPLWRLIRRWCGRARLPSVVAAVVLAGVAPAYAQATSPPVRPIGRVSFYVNSARTSDSGSVTSPTEFITSLNFQKPEAEGDGVEYGIDFRQASYTGADRASRMSLYDAYAGGRFRQIGRAHV
jgi:hypothetical protein